MLFEYDETNWTVAHSYWQKKRRVWQQHVSQMWQWHVAVYTLPRPAVELGGTRATIQWNLS